MPSDDALLRLYASQRDQRAFAELVARYAGLVYAAARRRSGRADVAEEVAQKVFADLGRKASALVGHPALAGWLHRSTRFAVIDAQRAEQRRRKLNDMAASMEDSQPPTNSAPEWDRLRPVIDQALDRLNKRDREIVLLRYYQGLSYLEVGARLDLKENTARMRADRALERLGQQLRRLGITSAGSALSVALADPAFSAIPAGLASSLGGGAFAAASSSTGGVAALILMNKTAIPILSALAASALTTVFWTYKAHGVTSQELNDLRTQHAALAVATRLGASQSEVASVAWAFSEHTAALSRRLRSRQMSASRGELAATTSDAPQPDMTPHFSDHGQATPRDARLSLAWAVDSANVDALSKLITFDGEPPRDELNRLLASTPAWFQAQYPTPEAFYAFLMAADALVSPPPREDVLEQAVPEEDGPGRVRFQPDGIVMQQTPSGWKRLIPMAGVTPFAQTVLTNGTALSADASGTSANP